MKNNKIKNKALLLFLLMTLASCFSNSKMMTAELYSSIHENTPFSKVREQAGTPYHVADLGCGGKQYEYIERINFDNQMVTENHYYFIVSKEGQIIGKRLRQESLPPFPLYYQGGTQYKQY